jgi:plastocyanin
MSDSTKENETHKPNIVVMAHSSWYKRPTVIISLMVLLLVAGGILISQQGDKKAPIYAAQTPSIAKVNLSKDGFSPSTVTIKVGSIVEWRSTDETGTHQVAANPVKTHTELPGLLSDQLGQGTVYRYKFTKTGAYHYHDEINPTLNGTVIVQ